MQRINYDVLEAKRTLMTSHSLAELSHAFSTCDYCMHLRFESYSVGLSIAIVNTD